MFFFHVKNGIQSGKVKVPEYKTKIENIISKLGVPVQVGQTYKCQVFSKFIPF